MFQAQGPALTKPLEWGWGQRGGFCEVLNKCGWSAENERRWMHTEAGRIGKGRPGELWQGLFVFTWRTWKPLEGC